MDRPKSDKIGVYTVKPGLVEDDETFTITLAASDTFLDAADEATATITDDDAAAFTLTVEPDAIAEAGGESTVTVSTGGVTFAEAQTFTLVLTGTAVKDTDYTIGSESLALAVGDSSVETTVTSRDDNIDDDAETVVVEARLDGEAVGTAQTITLSDDDEAGVAVSKESVSMTEGGSDTYTLALTSEPTADVTITVTRAEGGDADLTATPASLVFTASTWSAAQAVTIAAAEDDDFAEDAATFTHSASSDDANYGAGLAIASVAATATDNDTPDTTAPTITAVARSSPAAALTNADSLSWTVTFSEEVTVGAGAFGLSPAQSGATVTSTATDASPDDSWTVQASGGTELAGHEGALALSLADRSKITDAAGNALTGDLPTNAEGFTLDNTAPTVVSVERHDGTSAFDALTVADSLKFRVTFSEDVENVTAADFDASGAGDASGVEPVTGNAAQYIVTVSGGNLAGFDGTVGVVLALAGDIADAAGNAADTTLPSGEAYETYTLDSTAPTILRVERHNGTTAFAEVTDSDRLRFRVTFSEAVTNVDQSDFASTGASGASTVVRSTDDAAVWIVALREGALIDHNGVVGLILTGAQDIEDLVGHALNAALPAGTNYETYTVDNAPSVVSVTRDDGNGNDPGETTSADTLRFRVTFNESVVNVSTTDFVARDGANLALTVERAVSGSGASWLVTFSGGDITDRNGIVRLVPSNIASGVLRVVSWKAKEVFHDTTVSRNADVTGT